ncbi:hypothetical protein [Stackebrandtia nassauensis]|uniref:Uncharacterized protein n=1 Tax=Stackebrandtia nassauensis (strain DSM 44728 / CIP 108903 / NRRL B-16338 / NBRC 102104 / LLR-40K-21) TaxID=446470 RepID=D3PWL0_STANL|nr:hypothetical protein [Stackebrandtia nassauensis]ADD43232.1 hypothetical protein Snas_3570 [Stackebrandtia nassauensis DSM 44728]
MTVIDKMAELLLRLARDRWPERLREDRYREWSAEMYAIRNQESKSALQRAFGQFRFAFSLAVSPPGGQRHQTPGWRESLPGWGRRLLPLAVLFAFGAGCSLVVGQPRMLGVVFVNLSGGDLLWPNVVTVAFILALVAASAMLGHALGAHLPPSRQPRHKTARALSVVTATLAVGAGMLATWLSISGFASEGGETQSTLWTSPLLWMVAVVPLLLWAVWSARRDRVKTARWLGIAAGLVLLEVLALPPALVMREQLGLPDSAISASTAPLLFPASFLQPAGLSPELGTLSFTSLMPSMLAATTFTLFYVIRSCRATVRPVPPVVRSGAAAPAASTARAGFALAIMGLGLVTWAIAVAFTPPAADPLTDTGDPQFLMWSVELRLAAITVVATALALALVGRGRPFLPATVTGVGLLTADTILDATDQVGRTGLYGALGAGVVITAFTWWLGRTLLIAPPQERANRRAATGIAVVAALCAPAMLLQSTSPSTTAESGGTSATPAIFPAVTVAVTALLALVASASALAARRHGPTRLTAAATMVVPAGLLGSLAMFSGVPDSVAWIGTLAGLPFAVFLLALMWWERVRQRAKATGTWTALTLLSTVAMVPTLLIGFFASIFITGPLLTVTGNGGYPVDGSSIMPGILTVGISYGIGAAYILLPPPRTIAMVTVPVGA